MDIDPSNARTFMVPGLATVVINHDAEATVTIELAEGYDGDLRSLERHNSLPGNVLFQGNAAIAVHDPVLGRFIETLYHWDHDGDGIYDADDVRAAIMEALWTLRDDSDVYVRPDSGIYSDLIMKMMPPQPPRHIVMGFGQLKERFKLWHYAAAIPMILLVITLINLQIYYLPFMHYSVLSGLGLVSKQFGAVGLGISLAVFILVSRLYGIRYPNKKRPRSKRTIGFFNKAAVDEEQTFREGAEHWSWSQRVRSCLAFGLLHQINLFYPLATILPLSIGGALFMWRYLAVYNRTHFRRTAVMEAALLHRVYNRIALTIFLVFVLTTLTTTVIGLVTFVVLAVVNLAIGKVTDYVTVPPQVPVAERVDVRKVTTD